MSQIGHFQLLEMLINVPPTDFSAAEPALVAALETKVQAWECLRKAAWLVQLQLAGLGLLTPF